MLINISLARKSTFIINFNVMNEQLLSSYYFLYLMALIDILQLYVPVYTYNNNL